MYIKLNSKGDVYNFIRIALRYGNDITASFNGNIVSAKSVQSLTNMCIGKEIFIHIDTQESDVRREFFKKINKWRVE